MENNIDDTDWFRYRALVRHSVQDSLECNPIFNWTRTEQACKTGKKVQQNVPCQNLDLSFMHPVGCWRSSSSSFNYWLCNVAVTSQSWVSYLSSSDSVNPPTCFLICLLSIKFTRVIKHIFTWSNIFCRPLSPSTVTVMPVYTYNLFFHLFFFRPALSLHLCWQWVNVFSFNAHYSWSPWSQCMCIF